MAVGLKILQRSTVKDVNSVKKYVYSNDEQRSRVCRYLLIDSASRAGICRVLEKEPENFCFSSRKLRYRNVAGESAACVREDISESNPGRISRREILLIRSLSRVS